MYFLFILSFLAFSAFSNNAQNSFKLGVGIYDITGPAANVGMLGYAQAEQFTQGIHTRLWARSFVIESNNLIAISVLDAGFVTHSIRQAVIRELALALNENPREPKTFRFDNLTLMATHTHSGPGGFSHLTLYNLPLTGFVKENFNAIVQGTVKSILRAYQNREPGFLKWGETILENASHNRSKIAFWGNPERHQLDYDTNKKMSQIEFYSAQNRPLGLLNFFAVHATTLDNSNRMISSDNKGFASLLFDRKMSADYLAEKTFVAAFANGNEGDVTPNPIINGVMVREGRDHFEALEISGRRQFEAAEKIFNDSVSKEKVQNNIKTIHSFVELPGLKFDNQTPLCEPALGISFAAGAEDGPSGFDIVEGITAGVAYSFERGFGFLRFLTGGALAGSPLLRDDPCQEPKPVLLSTSKIFNKPWTPRVLPFQILQMGHIALVAFPGEVTTVAGKRIHDLVLQSLRTSGVSHVVIAGLANDYTNYLSTPEEYGFQQYEGASTLFGSNSLPVISRLYEKMAEALEEGRYFPSKPVPDFSKGVWSLNMGQFPDNKTLWESWGEELQSPESFVHRGDVVSVRFRTATPSNDLGTMQGLVEIQKKIKSEEGLTRWMVVARDWDPETQFQWRRTTNLICVSCGESTIRWTPSVDTKTGDYRILHRFSVKTLFGNLKKYEVYSKEFTVIN